MEAYEKYVFSGITKNITEALRLSKVDHGIPPEEIPLFITTPEIHRLKLILKSVRPQCDECSTGMYLGIDVLGPYGIRYPSAWTCKKCGLVFYSEMTPAYWLEELRRENRDQNLPGADKPDGS